MAGVCCTAWAVKRDMRLRLLHVVGKNDAASNTETGTLPRFAF